MLTDGLGCRLSQREQPIEEENNPDPATTSTASSSTAQPLHQNVPSGMRSPKPPHLPKSVESLQDDETVGATTSDDFTPLPVQLKRQPAKFDLGGSCSSSEQELVAATSCGVTAQKEQASFRNHVLTHTYDQSDPAVDSDTEAEYVDESAIDDDDNSSDWEDSIEDSGKSSVDEKFFQRVPSKVNMTSRTSLITLMVAQSERAKKLRNHASQSTSAIPSSRAGPSAPTLGASPNDSDEAPLIMKGMRHPTSTLKPISEIPRSSAQPIAGASHVSAQAALSPRTTCRNMLATELTESLRRHLLWERQQKTSTANAVLKRRHTSHDVANLSRFPDKPYMKDGDKDDATSWNQYFSKEALNGYHSKGW